MPVKSPIERVYYYECSYGKYHLTLHIPINELENLANQNKINPQALKDHPDGADIRVNESDYQDFYEAYGYKPETAPETVKTRFYTILSSTKEWRQYRGADLIPAKELEEKSRDIQKTIDDHAELMKIKPEEIKHIARTEATTPEEALEKYRRTIKNLNKKRTQLENTLRKHTPRGINPKQTMGEQKFHIQYTDGDPIQEVISRIQHKGRRST